MKLTRQMLVTAACLLVLACGGNSRRTVAAAQPSPMPLWFPSGDARLAFTLDLPPGPGPFPAVVVGHGSGRVTRADLQWFAGHWTALGFAVLRFDKRGVGESTGAYSMVGVSNSDRMIPLLASDIEAGVRFLKTRAEIDPRRIGLAGNSQAGWILPHAARNLGDQVKFLVLFSGPVCSVGLEIYYSDFAEETDTPLPEVYTRMGDFRGPPGYDNYPTIEAVKTPSLWLLGADDRSIPIRPIVANLQKLAAGGHPVEWRMYDGLGHSLAPHVWDDVRSWVARFK